MVDHAPVPGSLISLCWDVFFRFVVCWVFAGCLLFGGREAAARVWDCTMRSLEVAVAAVFCVVVVLAFGNYLSQQAKQQVPQTNISMKLKRACACTCALRKGKNSRLFVCPCQPILKHFDWGGWRLTGSRRSSGRIGTTTSFHVRGRHVVSCSK